MSDPQPTRADGLGPTLPRRPGVGDEPHAAKLDRFVVLRKLGEGGMGVVYAAYDEELERKVAIKLLRGGFHGTQHSVGQARLLREAQAMARLSHPNVAQVYQVGKLGDNAVYIAMEFISGGSLQEWLQREDRPWRTILGAYRQAGEGLAAAHRAGLVHRDFKPDNVLIGDDGRVRVVDFGLARHDEAPTEPGASSGAPVELTQVGSFIGTPAYMAPEQLRREPADALSDQFSFCAALFEGLYGYRPFKGNTTGELARAVAADERVDPPRDTEVPGRIHQILARGLSIAPERRFPTMDALLAALADDPELTRRRRLVAAGLVLFALLAAGVAGWAVYALQTRDAARCASASARLADVWGPDVAAAVRQAFAATGVAYADEVAARALPQLTAYADAWVDMSQSACEAHRRGEQSDALYDLRMTCLDDRRAALGALVGVLLKADAAVLEKAPQAVERLPTLARCADTRALLAQSPPPDDPDVARAVDDLRARLARTRAGYLVGQYQAARADLAQLRGEAEVTGHAPLVAAVLFLSGLVEDNLADYAAAESALLRAAATADRAGDDETRAIALVELVAVLGLRQARPDEALRDTELARGAVRRLPDGRPAEARLEHVLASVNLQRGDLDQASRHVDRALELHAELGGEDSTPYAAALDTRASLSFYRGDFAGALAEYRRVAAIDERVYGPHHPILGNVLNNIGAAELAQFRWPDAEATYLRALEVLRGAYGESHPTLAAVHGNLGLIALGQAQPARAIDAFQQALAIYEAHLPENHPDIAGCLLELGNADMIAGRLADAEQAFARALAVYLAASGPGHATTTRALASLGTAQLRAGRPADALRTFQRALDEFKGPPDDPALGPPLAGLGQLRLREDNLADAIPRLEAGLERLGRNPASPPYELADAEIALARALRRQDPARHADRCRALAGAAKDHYALFGAAFQPAIREIDAWLADLAPG